MTKTQKRWLSAYHAGFATQAEAMRRMKLQQRSDFYRLFHHYIISERDKNLIS